MLHARWRGQLIVGCLCTVRMDYQVPPTMPRSACFAALCAVVLLIGSASVSNAAKGIEDVDVALYGVHEPPFQYSLLEQDAASMN